MTVGIKAISEYNRQYQWHETPPPDPIAGLPTYKEYKSAEPPLQANQRPTLELSSKEELPEVIQTFGTPSKDLHIVREPSFSSKKRVPGASPERVKVNKSLAKKAGLSQHVNPARYQSVYAAEFSLKKGALPKASSPIQSAKINFVDSKTNLPIGKKPVDKKVTSEYDAQFSDPTEAMSHIRELYREQIRRKQLELDRISKDIVKTRDEQPPKPAADTAAAETLAEAVSVTKPEEKEPERKAKLKIYSPLRADKPRVRATYDLIAPQKPLKLNWQSEYKTRFASPGDASVSTAYGRRSHPYQQIKSPERVGELMKPDKSDIVKVPSPKSSVNWFQEVLELRNLAHEFKARSHGSHFSPDKMATLAFSNARLRESQPSPAVKEESVTTIPVDKTSSKDKKIPDPKTAEAENRETDMVITDLEEECPNIENLVIKTKSLIESPEKPLPPKSSVKSSAVPIAAEKGASESSTPRTADRTCSLFEGRVSTPKLKNIGSRHHLDRTTQKRKNERISSNTEMKTALMAGRAATPVIQESRHHLDPTTPAALKGLGTQPFSPEMSNKVQEKLDFTTPRKANGWTKDLDNSVLSRASSCTSLAGATLDKAKQRNTDFWK